VLQNHSPPDDNETPSGRLAREIQLLYGVVELLTARERLKMGTSLLASTWSTYKELADWQIIGIIHANAVENLNVIVRVSTGQQQRATL
jgi:hypothetical protein